MKVQLIQPGTGEYRGNSRSGCYPPLGLVSIATYLRRKCPEVEVEILDAELLVDCALERAMGADIVGLSTNTVNYPQALALAGVAKAQGCRVILGGVHASALPGEILSHRGGLVDAVVVGYGELPMERIVRGDPSRLFVEHSPPPTPPYFPDRTLLPLEEYISRFQDAHPTWNARGAHLSTNHGCEWKYKSGGCIFCSRFGRTPYYRAPFAIWAEVRDLVERFRVDYLVNFSDSMLQDRCWLRAVVEARPRDLSPRWHVFARIDEIDTEAIELLKGLNCCHIFLGVESGDFATYRGARKGGGSPATALAAASELKKAQISITPAYVIGLPGETSLSARKTVAHARALKRISAFEEVFCCELVPFPGSPAFDAIRPNADSVGSDLFDADVLKREWAQHACEATPAQMTEAVAAILSLGTYPITIRRGECEDADIDAPQDRKARSHCCTVRHKR